MAITLFTCVVCKEKYDSNKSRADFRGLCSKKCEHSLEKTVGIKQNTPYDSFKSKLFHEKLRRLRKTTPGADPLL